MLRLKILTKKIKNLILDVVFPPLCLACKKHAQTPEEKAAFLCGACKNKIDIATGFFCSSCDKRLPYLRPCPMCRRKKNKHSEEGGEEIFMLAAATCYQNPIVKELIHTLKYQKVKSTMKPFGFIINEYLQTLIKNDKSHTRTNSMQDKLKTEELVLIPIPLHKTKERERGFNQAELITNVIANTLCRDMVPKVKINSKTLIRTKSTKSQTELREYKSRKKNVTGCFTIKNRGEVKGKNIILVDDVFTSGATMKEAIQTLREAGARTVLGFVIAKA